MAATFAKELLETIVPYQVTIMTAAADVLNGLEAGQSDSI